MKLSVWAKSQGISYQTAWRMWQQGRLPLPATQLPTGTIIVEQNVAPSPGAVAIYARVSSHDQKSDLERQVGRLTSYAVGRQLPVTSVITEVASGLNGRRPRLLKLLADPTIKFIIVEHRERLARFGFEYVMANRKLARASADVGMYEFRRQLSYKAEMRGVRVVVADRFFLSSQLCSTPGCEERAVGLGLAVRSWTCSGCNTTHDRDLNAAKNLERYSTVSSTGINACGAGSSVAPGQPGRRSPALKQESNVVMSGRRGRCRLYVRWDYQTRR